MKSQISFPHHTFIFIFVFIVFLATTAWGPFPDPIAPLTTNWALQFDGNSDMVQLYSEADIIGSDWKSTKSVDLWVKPDAGNNCSQIDPASCPSIFSAKPHWWGISVGLTHPSPPEVGQDRIWVWNFDIDEDFIAIPYTPGEWVNIALVHRSGQLFAYKNGVLAGSKSSGDTHEAEPGKLYLGGLVNTNLFAGQIDEVSIWDVGLSADQITSYMYSIAGGEAGLKAYYKMSDGSGRTLTDDSIALPDWPGTLIDNTPPSPPGDPGPLWVVHNDFVPPIPPAASTNLTATQANYSQVNLSWIDQSDNEFSFEIERCTGASCNSFSPMEVVLDSVTSYTDANVVQGTTYCYRVRAANTGGASTYTNTACALVPIPNFLPLLVRD